MFFAGGAGQANAASSASAALQARGHLAEGRGCDSRCGASQARHGGRGAGGRYLVLEVNVDDFATKISAGSHVGITTLRRITRGMPAEDKKYVDRAAMLAAFAPPSV